jgi:mRNA interferase MazF
MPPTISYDFGDVVLVPFPFTDQSASKQRPAVVVSSQTFHRESSDIIVAAITTRPRPWSSLEVPITDWQGAGLLYPSVIKPVLGTFDRRLVLKRIGKLQTTDRSALKDAIATILG